MKLGITGSLEYKDYEHFKSVLLAIPVPITLIVTGGQEGIEKMARRYGREHHLPVLIHHAKAAAHIDWLVKRNAVLVNDADTLLVFNYPGTRTLGLIKSMAANAGRKCKVVYLTPDRKPESIAARYGETI